MLYSPIAAHICQGLKGRCSKARGLAVQAAVVPLLVSTANVSGIQWDMVDGSALTAQKTAALQVEKSHPHLQQCFVLQVYSAAGA